MLLLAEESKGSHPSQQVAQLDRRGFAGKHLRCIALGRTALFVAVLLGVSACCARAQSTLGSVLGTVSDASVAVIPGATVTIRSLDQDLSRKATTGNAGDFLVENLKPGHYSITVEHDGFSKAVVPDAQLDARQALRIPLTLTVAAQSTEVVVTATGYQINTEDATLSNSKDNQQITELPLNDRATTTSPLGSLQLSSNVQQDSSGNIALGGASSSMVNFSVDGISTTNVRQNGALQDAYPSLEGQFPAARVARMASVQRHEDPTSLFSMTYRRQPS
ncbi:MAG TPA: carboxypeptidase-like regulatory domain-containing protein [Silvibacterium sp.]|nr:carboxypeptidase-like regulatory domain-containing protein [Silvibacterium sp.]